MLSFFFSVLVALAGADTVYQSSSSIPLSFSRVLGSASVTGLAPKVSVVTSNGNVSLLASTAMTESASGSGVYTYVWSPTIQVDTPCLVTYTVGTQVYKEYITIVVPPVSGRAY